MAGTAACCRTPSTARTHTPGAWDVLVELLLDPGGVVDGVRDRRRERRTRQRARATLPVCSATLHPPGDVPRRRPGARGTRPRRIVLETARATLAWLVPEDQVQRSMRVTRRSVRGAHPPTG
ncbi:hypothetical protein [Geodermatophilus sp. URMC 63]